jgi:hypothetical protein
LGKDSKTGMTEMVSSVGHSCEKSSDLLSQYMNYKVFGNCQDDWSFAQKLMVLHCCWEWVGALVGMRERDDDGR